MAAVVPVGTELFPSVEAVTDKETADDTPLTPIVVVAVRVPPAVVVHLSTIFTGPVIALVDAIPLVLVLLAFRVVNSGMSGDETLHACIPLVTHPTVDLSPDFTVCGFATSTIEGRAICTVQSLRAMSPWFIHAIWKFRALAPCGGFVIIVLVAPESAPSVLNPFPTLAVAFPQLYVIATDMPTSATSG